MADMYSDNPGGDQADPTTASAGADTSDSADNKTADEEGETFLVPKSALGGKEPKPGDTCEFKVERVYEDECEFSYVKHGNSETKEENPDMDKANEDMESMAE